MKESTRFFAPLAALMLVILALQWAASTSADAVVPGEEDGFSTAPFEYFPSQYVLDAAEAGEDIPTF